MLLDTHLMKARRGFPRVDDVRTLKHFFPCLDPSQLIDTKGGVVYTPMGVTYDTTKNTFTGEDNQADARAIDSGDIFDFGTNSFGVIIVADANTLNASYANSMLLGNRVTPVVNSPSIFVGGSSASGTNNPRQASGFNDNNSVHFTARHLNTLTEGDTYIFQLTCDRENNVLTSKIFNITSNRFDTYTQLSLLPFRDGNFTDATTLTTSTTDMSAFITGSNICTSAYNGGFANEFSNLTVGTGGANSMIVTGASFTTDAVIETIIQDGVTSVRQYPDYPNTGHSTDATPVSVNSAAGLTPGNFMKTVNLAMYGAAYFSFEEGVPSDWDYACSWMAWAAVQGYRVPYPNSVYWV